MLGDRGQTTILSYDEKPGIQAIGNIFPDKPPGPNHGTASRNHDYVRHGTVSLLTCIDLITGHIISSVTERHSSSEFIQWLNLVDLHYPDEYTVTIILDNHSIHKSMKTMAYLSSKPRRFKFVFTPTHASWLNIIETFFSKISRSMIRGIRVVSKEEQKERIISYTEAFNKEPDFFSWK